MTLSAATRKLVIGLLGVHVRGDVQGSGSLFATRSGKHRVAFSTAGVQRGLWHFLVRGLAKVRDRPCEATDRHVDKDDPDYCL